jgi:protein AATF/BFR2
MQDPSASEADSEIDSTYEEEDPLSGHNGERSAGADSQRHIDPSEDEHEGSIASGAQTDDQDDEDDGLDTSEHEADAGSSPAPPLQPATQHQHPPPPQQDALSSTLRQKRAEDVKKGAAVARQLVRTLSALGTPLTLTFSLSLSLSLSRAI